MIIHSTPFDIHNNKAHSAKAWRDWLAGIFPKKANGFDFREMNKN